MSTKVIKTKFGTVFTKLNTEQHKIINQLAFTTTDPSNSGVAPKSIFDGSTNTRHVPEYNIKTDHLLISNIELKKNLKSGSWEIAKIITNHGDFATGTEHNNKIQQNLVRELALHLKQILEADIVSFLQEEVKLNSNTTDK